MSLSAIFHSKSQVPRKWRVLSFAAGSLKRAGALSLETYTSSNRWIRIDLRISNFPLVEGMVILDLEIIPESRHFWKATDFCAQEESSHGSRLYSWLINEEITETSLVMYCSTHFNTEPSTESKKVYMSEMCSIEAVIWQIAM